MQALTLLAFTRSYGELPASCCTPVTLIGVQCAWLPRQRGAWRALARHPAVSQLRDVVDQAKQVERQVRAADNLPYEVRRRQACGTLCCCRQRVRQGAAPLFGSHRPGFHAMHAAPCIESLPSNVSSDVLRCAQEVDGLVEAAKSAARLYVGAVDTHAALVASASSVREGGRDSADAVDGQQQGPPVLPEPLLAKQEEVLQRLQVCRLGGRLQETVLSPLLLPPGRGAHPMSAP